MTTISPGEALVTISAGTVEDDDYEDIFLNVEVRELDTNELREEFEWYMQKHEAECVIAALKVALSALEEEE